MMWAAIKGLTEVVSLLLAAGAEIDLQNWVIILGVAIFRNSVSKTS